MAVSMETTISLLERALGEEIGVSVRTDDAKAFRREFWEQKQELGDPQYARIITFVPTPELCFICKKDVEL